MNASSSNVEQRERRAPKKPKANSSLAKLTAPRLASVVNRTRLFDLLDTARERPIVWISSPAGSGKTTLVASYLQERKLSSIWYQIDAGDNDPASFFHYLAIATKSHAPHHRKTLPGLMPEYFSGLTVFARNFFRDVFSVMRSSSVLILDNYQDMADNAMLHSLLAVALEEVPRGISVFLLSRVEHPPSFARLDASSRIAKLAWNDMRLSEPESARFVEYRLGTSGPSSDVIMQLHRDAQGWAAGMVLLIEKSLHRPASSTVAHAIGTQAIFDYFANESFDEAEPRVRDFLIRTSFLPTISLFAAQSVTSEQNAGATLHELARRNMFTTRCETSIDAYQYHPLFRAFLQQRAERNLSKQEVVEIKRCCAAALAEEGSVDTAIGLFLESEDWVGVCGLIVQHAATLHAQGRGQTLIGWIEKTPEAYRNAEPWMLYWLGMCHMPLNPMTAVQQLECAFSLFANLDDASPLHLTWAAILESYFYSWRDRDGMSKWLDLYPRMALEKRPPSMEIELTSVVRYLTSVTHTRLYDNSSAQLVFRAEHLLQQVPITYRSAMDANALALLYVERAEFAKAQELLCRFAPKSADSMLHPVWHLLSCFTNGIRAHYMGLDEHALEQLTSARSKALQSGVRVLDSQILMMLGIVYLGHGNIVAARTILDEMSQHPAGRNGIRGYYYSNLLVSVLLREGNTGSALAGALQSLQICNSPGTVFEYASSLRVSAGARVKHGDIDGALDDIAKARALVTNSTSGIFHYLLNFTEAVVFTIKGDYSAALVALDRAIAIANKASVLVPPSYCQPEDVAILFSRALDSDVHTEFVRRAIRNMNLAPPAKYSSERWPWRYRIYTLGRFEIVKDGIPLRFEGKAQRRPLDLLKALIAFGGRKVSQEQLASVLWPDADGDAANASFTITLHRLRKLLGSDEVVIVENSELSLDAGYLWVDAWAFERSVASIRDDSEQADSDIQAKQVFSYYHGPFLASDSTSWAVSPRERLRRKFLQAVSVVADRYQKNGLWAAAAQWYERGIEVDAVAEDLYFKLMTCYQNLDRRSDALSAYSRCAVALASAFQIQPTRKVQALFDVIRRST